MIGQHHDIALSDKATERGVGGRAGIATLTGEEFDHTERLGGGRHRQGKAGCGQRYR
jgi:hypothetical protein